MDESTQEAQPQAQPDLAADEALDCPMDSSYPYLPSLSADTPSRHHLRQEPGAVVPHAGICAGGAGQPASLPRPKNITVYGPCLFFGFMVKMN